MYRLVEMILVRAEVGKSIKNAVGLMKQSPSHKLLKVKWAICKSKFCNLLLITMEPKWKIILRIFKKCCISLMNRVIIFLNSFIVFGLVSVLGLFRGPLTVWGAGAATLTMFQSIGGIFSANVLLPLFMVPTTTVNGSICPTQSWCLWAIGYTKASLKDYLKTCLPYALVVSFILEIVAYFIFAA
jgi:hypothetical protein